MKFITNFNRFPFNIDTEDIENIFIPATDMGYKLEYEFVSSDTLVRFLATIGNDFLLYDTVSGVNKIHTLEEIGNFLSVTLDRDFSTGDGGGFAYLEPHPASEYDLYKRSNIGWVETSFNKNHRQEMIEILEEVEDRLLDNYDFINNFYITSYENNTSWMRIHYFIFEKNKVENNIPKEEFNFKGSN